MKHSQSCATAAVAVVLALVLAVPACADEPIRIGISAGLSGYVATVDRAWTDAIQLGVEQLNVQGGLLGRKIEVVVDDNHSQPQDAVTGYRKMIDSDKVDMFLSGCVSAGNFAGAAMEVKAELPNIMCSVLPTPPQQLHWSFTTTPFAKYEVEKRLEFLKDSTSIRKIGVLHDPSPYGVLQKNFAVNEAKDYGLEVVDVEQYQPDDADLSVQLRKMSGVGAGAFLKIGLGGTTITAAKNEQALGLDMLMLTSIEDIAVFKPVSDILGQKFYYVASPSQVYEALPDGRQKQWIGAFLKVWRAKYGERDPNAAGRGWDAVMIWAEAVKHAKTVAGAAVRDGLEGIEDFQGTTGIFSFSKDHYGLSDNPYVIAHIVDGKVALAK